VAEPRQKLTELVNAAANDSDDIEGAGELTLIEIARSSHAGMRFGEPRLRVTGSFPSMP